MNLKDFLKPTKEKLLVTVIFFLLFAPVIQLGTWIPCPKTGECPSSFNMRTISLANLFLLKGFALSGEGFRVGEMLLGESLIWLLALYILTCILAFLCSKFPKSARSGKNKR